MMPLLLGIFGGLVQASFFGALVPTGWPFVSGVALVVYLNRFNLRRFSRSTAWCLGLTLDLLSSWPFGIWLILMLLVDTVADQAMPAKASGIPPATDIGLVWFSSFLIGCGQAWANNTAWFGPSFWSAAIVSLLYYVFARATLVWRIYE